MTAESMVGQLVERIRKRDQRAMRQLYQEYVELLSSVCYRYVFSEADAKDVLQNSFVKIFTSLPSLEFRGEAALRGWMIRIVVNEALGFLRQRHKLQFVDKDTAFMQQIAEEETPDSTRLSPDDLHNLIRELPDGCRTVLNLYVFEGFSHKRIAELLGIKENTSASQFHYAKRLLGRRIKELTKEE